jgi:uncharacterized membrane protein
MTLPTFLASAVESWATFYDKHQMVSVTVRYLHLAGLLVGGGTALATDRHVLRAARSGPSERAASLAALDASHRVVVPALAVVVLTGLLMTASDTATFLGSRLYWSKMGLVTLLLLNGVGLLAAERAVSQGRARGWRGLGFVSGASLCLWLVILFVGIWLTAAA